MTVRSDTVNVTSEAEGDVRMKSAGGGRKSDKVSKKCSRWERNHLGSRRWRQTVADTGATESILSMSTQICSSGAGTRAGCRAVASQLSNRQGLVGGEGSRRG